MGKQRAALVGRIEEAEAWHSWRQDQVDELHAEAGERAPNWRQPAGTAGNEEVREQIRDHFLPELQTIIEHAAGNPEMVDRLSILAAGLAEAEGKLETNVGDRAQMFNMAGGDVETDGWDQEDGEQDGAGGKSGCSNRVAEGTARVAEWKPEGQGRWSRSTAAAQHAAANEGTTTSAAAPRAKGATDGLAKGSDESGGDVTSESPAKTRKLTSSEDAQADARAEADRQRGMALLQQQKAAEDVQVQSFNHGMGGFGSQAALSAAAQRFVLEVQRAEARAAEQGIAAIHDDGRQLLQLSPMELEEWVGERLGDEGEQL